MPNSPPECFCWQQEAAEQYQELVLLSPDKETRYTQHIHLLHCMTQNINHNNLLQSL